MTTQSSPPEPSPTESAYPDELRTHTYDGIREYDNPMPGWWSAIFVLSVIWAGIYVIAAILGFVGTYQQSLTADLKTMRQKQAAVAAEAPTIDAATLAEAAKDPKVVAAGKQVFATNCASCHGNVGQGLIGPNLTDDAWLHGDTELDIFQTITDGVASKGMPTWGPILSTKDRIAAVAFIESIQGTNPPDAKPPQGKVSKPN